MSIPHIFKRKISLGVIISLLFILFSLRQINRSWDRPPRFYEESTISMGSWLKLHTDPGERIFLLNTWDHIYVLSETLPATNPWYPYLPWYLAYDSVETGIIQDLMTIKPKYIISENLKSEASNRIESYVYTYYLPSLVLNNRFTVWTPK
jgi:hypothetical protein